MKTKDVVKFLESKETYKKVMKVLSDKAGLSINLDGFIAGGSVANTLYSMVYGDEPIIRDIDIFHIGEPKNSNDFDNWVEPTNPNFPTPIETQLSASSDGYGNRVVRPNGDFSIMLSHSRDGIFNHIEVHVGSRKPNPNKELILIQSFDLNACQAGLDIKNKKIIYTDEFILFLGGRQLNVTTPINPIQTSIRLRRKIKDLKCYCNVEYEINILKHTCLLNQTSKTFGEETYNKYIEYKNVIDKDFKIVRTEWSSTPNSGDDGKQTKLWQFTPNLVAYDTPYLFNHPLEMLNYFRLKDGTMGDKLKKYQKVVDSVYCNGILDDIDYSTNINDTGKSVRTVMLSLPYDYLKHKNSILKNLKDTKVHEITHPMWGFLTTIKGYYDCDFDTKHIDYIVRFVREHRNMSWSFTNVGNFTIQKHYQLIKLFKSIANKKGDWVIGELENMESNKLDEMISSPNITEWVNDYINNVEINLSDKLIDPLDLSGFEFNDCITELTNVLDLRSEGIKMGHCVGGYGSKIKKGGCRIFHIECDGIGSTLEVGLSGSLFSVKHGSNNRPIPDDWLYSCPTVDIKALQELDKTLEYLSYNKTQHNGRYPNKGNLQPTDTNKEIVSKFMDYLNDNLLEHALKDILWERHLLEKKIRKIVLDRTVDLSIDKTIGTRTHQNSLVPYPIEYDIPVELWDMSE